MPFNSHWCLTFKWKNPQKSIIFWLTQTLSQRWNGKNDWNRDIQKNERKNGKCVCFFSSPDSLTSLWNSFSDVDCGTLGSVSDILSQSHSSVVHCFIEWLWIIFTSKSFFYDSLALKLFAQNDHTKRKKMSSILWCYPLLHLLYPCEVCFFFCRVE